jgi:hypothetical protein
MVISALALASVAVRPAPAQEMIGIDFLLGDVFSINAKDGQSVLIGSTGLTQSLWHSMAKDSQGRLFAGYGYWNVPHGIYQIDPVTGQATFIVQTSLLGLRGLAFGPGDVLYGTNDTTTPLGGGPDDLVTIDLVTGATTIIGPTGLKSLQSLAFGNGILWGWDTDNVGLVSIDTVTGLATDVNPALEDNLYLIETLCFSDDGILYGAQGSLWIIDMLTGAPTFVAYMPPIGLLGGIEFAPGQPAPFSLGVKGTSGGPMGAFAAGATPGGSVAILFAQGGGGPTLIQSGMPCSGNWIDLNGTAALIQVARADAQGKIEIGPAHVPPLRAGNMRLQALDLTTCATSNVARVLF